MDDLYEEMQKIFSNCPIENNDKIRTSVFIKAMSDSYDINDELKSKLVNKLDPDENDTLYSKDELFIIFKDWISSGNTVDRSSPIMFTSPGCSYTSTPALRSGLLRRRFTRTRLFIHDGKPMSSLGNHNRNARVVQSSSDHSESPFFGSDEVDVDVSSSSSTKKRLSHHRSILESKLENFEKHASSLEKRYEDANSVCALQKLEIERLKMELKTRHETEQTMEEIGEQIRKQELETEKKCAKLQADLIHALSRIQELDNMVTNLKEDLCLAENKILNGGDLLISLQNELTEKDQVNEELQQKLLIMEQQKLDNDQAILNLLEENAGLIIENNELKNNISVYSQPRVQENGVPLCEELPSEMLRFPIKSSFCAVESFATSREESVEFKSSCCQTEVLPTHIKDTHSASSLTEISSLPSSTALQIQVKEMQSSSSQTYPCELLLNSLHSNYEQLSVSSQTEMLVFDQAEMPSSSCQTEHEMHTNSTQTKLSQMLFNSTQTDLEIISNCSQTEIRTMKHGYTQTELFPVDSKHSQTKLLQSFSQQTELYEFVSLSCQTEPFEVHSSSTQTETLSTFCQTEDLEMPSIFCQTEPFEVYSSSTQTEILSTFCQTEVLEMPSIFCQTEPFEVYSSSTQTEMFSTLCQTEVLEMSSIFCQTDILEIHSNTTENEVLSTLSQAEIQDVFSRSSQAVICGSQKNARETDKRFLTFSGHSPAYLNTELRSNRQMFEHIPILRIFIKLVCLITSPFPSPNRVGRYVYSWVKFTFVTIVSLLIAVVAIFFTFFFICQNNRCQLELRYPRGMPPV